MCCKHTVAGVNDPDCCKETVTRELLRAPGVVCAGVSGSWTHARCWWAGAWQWAGLLRCSWASMRWVATQGKAAERDSTAMLALGRGRGLCSAHIIPRPYQAVPSGHPCVVCCPCRPMLCCAVPAQGTVVAVKRLLTDDATTIERFVSEVRLLARLRHPNLILFMGYCITPELCIVSEFMSKGSLYGVLHSPEQRKQRLAAATGTALPAPGAGEDGVGSGGPPSRQASGRLQGQPSLAEGQLPLEEEVR